MQAGLKKTAPPQSTDQRMGMLRSICLEGLNHRGYILPLLVVKQVKITTRMWAKAQRDGCPAYYRWHPLFNAAVWLTPTTTVPCSKLVTLPRRETRWNLQGWPKLAKVSQPLVGQSSPYYEDMWRRYCCLISFFPRLWIRPLVAKIQPNKVVRWCQNGDFLRPVFAASRMPHISDMHSKFALRPHHVWKYGRHPISDRWD